MDKNTQGGIIMLAMICGTVIAVAWIIAWMVTAK